MHTPATACRQLCTARSHSHAICGGASGDPANGPQTLCYVRAPGRSRPFSPAHLEPRLPPRRSIAAPVSEPDPATIWHRFRTEARRAVSETTWHIWLERLTLRELAGTTLVLEAPDDVRSWVETRFARLLGALAETVIGPGARVEIVGPEEQLERRAPAPGGPARRGRAGAQPAADVRPVRDRRLQPARPRRRARGGRDARPGLQPALHLRPARARQDPPAALDRQLRARARRRPDRPLHDRRGVHRPLRRRAPGRRPRGVQGGLPRRRRPARRRRPVPAEQGQDRAGVLPHLQRAAPGRRPARADLRPPAARPRGARGPAARALRGRPGVRRPPARARHPPDDPAQARRPGRRRRGRPRRARADRRPRRRRTSARSRAR